MLSKNATEEYNQIKQFQNIIERIIILHLHYSRFVPTADALNFQNI